MDERFSQQGYSAQFTETPGGAFITVFRRDGDRDIAVGEAGAGFFHGSELELVVKRFSDDSVHYLPIKKA